MERLSPLRALLRRVGHGRDHSHDQSAPVPRAARVHRRSRAGCVRVLRRDVRAAGFPARAGVPRRAWLDRVDRPRARSGNSRRGNGVLRRPAHCGGRRLRMAAIRGEHRVGALLHVGHDGKSQGRPLQPPVHGAARICRGAARCQELLRAKRRAADRAHVPRQCLGHSVFRPARRREAGAARARARRQERLRADGSGARDELGRRADRMARPRRAHARERIAPIDLAHDDDRRLGLPGRADEGAHQGIRPARAARVGHDGDESGRHRRHVQGEASRAARGGAHERRAQAGAAPLRRRHEDRRCERPRAAVGWQVGGQPARQGAVDRSPLLP